MPESISSAAGRPNSNPVPAAPTQRETPPAPAIVPNAAVTPAPSTDRSTARTRQAAEITPRVGGVTDFSRKGTPLNDDVLVVGMNKEARQESAVIQASADKRKTKVTLIQPDDQAIVGLDLKKDEEIERFAKGLGLKPEQTEGLIGLLKRAPENHRSTLAQLAQAWAPAENGGKIPSRLVLSGHSSGQGIFNEMGQKLQFNEIASLAELMPKAAGQIEDLHLGACNSGFKTNNQVFKSIFPNLKTFWGYTNAGPKAGQNANDLKSWENATRGRANQLKRETFIKGPNPSSSNLAVSSAAGYQAKPDKRNAADYALYDLVSQGLSGDVPLSPNPYAGPIYDAYQEIQSRQNQNPTPEQQKAYVALKSRAQLMRSYGTVSANFDKAFGEEMGTAFQTAGLPAPEFGRLNRADTLQTIRNFKQACEEKWPARHGDSSERYPANIERALALCDALSDLSPPFDMDLWINPFQSNDAKQTERMLQTARRDFNGLTRDQVRAASLKDATGILRPDEQETNPEAVRQMGEQMRRALEANERLTTPRP